MISRKPTFNPNFGICIDISKDCANLKSMNRLILIFALFAFLAGGLSEAAHAAMPNVACTHQAADVDNAGQDCVNDQTQDQADLEQCQDCCCIHAHVLAAAFPDTSITDLLKKRMALMPHGSLRSNDHSPLYRPPIA